MTPQLFTQIFLVALVASLMLHAWLSLRHLRHVSAHRTQIPAEFAASISLAEHQKAADYTCAKVRLGLLELAIANLMLLTFTLGGLLQAVENLCRNLFPESAYLHGLALFAGVGLISFVIDLPFDLYRTFKLEARFGFNQSNWRIFVGDLFKNILLAILIGAPLLLIVLWLMHIMGAQWWLTVWIVWLGFNLLMLLLYPTVIAPLFNKFAPLDNPELQTRIEALLTRCGFRSSGLFVMDGSKRSSHGNAYFTGFGVGKRIVFFDTLLERLAPSEIEAVLAHELGHYHHRHVWQRIILLALLSLGLLWLLGQLIDQPWFYAGLGIIPNDLGSVASTALALILFSFVLPVFTFPFTPVMAQFSRRHEYQADRYAAHQTRAADLISALVKLYRDNASTLTPDPLHSLFHDSHPPASLRIRHLQTLQNQAPVKK